MPTFQVTGLAEVSEMLKSAPRTLVATGFTRALSAAGNVVADEVEGGVSVRTGGPSGSSLSNIRCIALALLQ